MDRFFSFLKKKQFASYVRKKEDEEVNEKPVIWQNELLLDKSINDLPCEILMNIFCRLSLKNRWKLRSVCKKFYELCLSSLVEIVILDAKYTQTFFDFYLEPRHQPCNVLTLTFDDDSYETNKQNLTFILQKSRLSIKRFSLYGEIFRKDNPALFALINQVCPNLTCLYIHDLGPRQSYPCKSWYLYKHVLKVYGQQLERVRAFSDDSTALSLWFYPDDKFSSLTNYLNPKKLKSLQFNVRERQQIALLCYHFPMLDELVIRFKTKNAFKSLKVLTMLPHLKRFSLEHSDSTKQGYKSSYANQIIYQGPPYLYDLDYMGPDRPFQFEYMLQLQKLQLDLFLKDEDFERLCTSLVQLEELAFYTRLLNLKKRFCQLAKLKCLKYLKIECRTNFLQQILTIDLSKFDQLINVQHFTFFSQGRIWMENAHNLMPNLQTLSINVDNELVELGDLHLEKNAYINLSLHHWIESSKRMPSLIKVNIYVQALHNYVLEQVKPHFDQSPVQLEISNVLAMCSLYYLRRNLDHNQMAIEQIDWD